jgi:uncharacterized protein (TIGR00730 family)
MKKINQNHYFSKSDIHGVDIESHLQEINSEFKAGFEFVKKFPKSVSIFGSSRAKPGTSNYQLAEKLAERIVSELNYAVVTGGGPGIMEAANKGAKLAHGHSVGMNVSLPHERKANDFLTDEIHFTYFFARKTMLTFAAEAYIFMPGGFGTFDELFSILTLIQTGKIPRVPVILFGSSFWDHLRTFINEQMIAKENAVDPDCLEFIEITDSEERVIEIIRKAPVSEWWRSIN